LAAFLQLLKETGARVGEACALKWTDVDFERGIVTINDPEKSSEPRQINVSDKLLKMLRSLRKRDEKIFVNKKSMNKLFCRQRKILAYRLNNPRLPQISFHTFRHWHGTMFFHKTKSVPHTAQRLGHKNWKNTQIYVHLEAVLFTEESDSFYSAVADTVEHARKLVESGFDYICDFSGVKIFRKRK